MSGTVTPLNALDTSIPLRAGQGVTPLQNPLDTFGKVAGIQNALTSNRAMEAGIAQTEQGTAGMAQTQKLQRLQLLAQHAGSLVLQYPNGVPAKALAASSAQALTMGLLDRNEIGPLLQSIPMGDDAQSTAARTQMLNQFHVQGLGIAEQINRSRGVPTLIQTGGSQQPALVGERVMPMGGAIPNTLSPGEQNSVQNVPEIVDGKPTGRMMPVTGAQIAAGSGNQHLLPGGAFPTTGRPAAAPIAPVTPSPVAAPTAAPAAPAGPRPVTLGPGIGLDTSTAMVGNAAEGVKQGAALMAQADTIPQQRGMLGEMEDALDKFSTGKGQQTVLNYQGYIQSLAPDRIAKALGIDPQKIASGETFTKLATQIALAQGSALGVNTDAARSSLFGGNPNMELSKLGNRQIIHMLKGNADAIAAKAQAWAESPLREKGDYARFSSTWNAQNDPRVFQWAHMDKAERDIMLSGAGRDKTDLAAKIRAMYAPPGG